MINKQSFYTAGSKNIIIVLLSAFLWAFIIALFVLLLDGFSGSIISSWKSLSFFSLIGFCIGLGFRDDEYSGLRPIGATIGAISGILTIFQISTEPLIFTLLISLIGGFLGGIMGYILVARFYV